MTTNTKYPIKKAEEILPLVLSEQEVVFVDIESTGFGQYDDITEIGAIRVDVKSGHVLGKFSTFVHLKTQKRVSSRITDLTGITTEMLANAPLMEVALPAFQRFIGNSVLAFHNASFDWRMIQSRFEQLGQRLFNPVICTYKLFKYLHPDLPANLDAVTSFYGRHIEGHHRAYVDCKWTAACYRKMRDELLERVNSGKLVLSSYPEDASTPRMLSEREIENCVIYNISGWKKKDKSRIYCQTSIGDIFYDIPGQFWNVSKKKGAFYFDVNLLVRTILRRLGLNQQQFVEKYELFSLDE